jgi:hypothetical protein
VEVLRLVMNMTEAGDAWCVAGNHDVKLLKKLKERKQRGGKLLLLARRVSARLSLRGRTVNLKGERMLLRYLYIRVTGSN